MKKLFVFVLTLAMIVHVIPICATADGGSDGYIIPETEYMDVTYEELESWDYESLGYILNEIFDYK